MRFGGRIIGGIAAAVLSIGLAAPANAAVPEIKIIPGSTINLVAHESLVPVSIKNEFNADIRVFVHMRPSNARVRVPSAVEVVVPALTTINAQVPVQAVASGKVFMRVWLTTFSGIVLTDEIVLQMNVEPDLETIIFVTFGGSVAILLSLGVLRTLRKRQRRLAEEVQELN